METLTKEQLLQGAEYREEIEIDDIGGVKGRITIRPITAREWMNISTKRVKEMESSGAVKKSKFKNEATLDLVAIQSSTFSSKCELVSLAMVSPTMTPVEVEKMRINIVNQINNRVRVISGIDEDVKEEIASFRDERGRDESRDGSDELPAR